MAVELKETCEACGSPMDEDEEDLVLDDLSHGEVYRYHQFCGKAAWRKVEEADPDTWRVTSSRERTKKPPESIADRVWRE